MKFISVELKGFKRLALNSIDYIKITPENKIQLILGTNGSGKSSLMKELTPLPANHQEFHKDGFKIIELVHNNSHYVLKSIFGQGGNRFHFIKDGEDLNDGGTMTTYRELVRREFNITADVHELMIGAVRFHAMTTAERRSWFTRLSDADYTYAIKYFQKLKELHRDMIGAIKTNQSRLVQESEKLLKPEQELTYREEIKMFSEMLTQLLELKTPIYETRDQVARQLEGQDLKLTELARSLVKYRKQFLNLENYSSVDDIDQAIVDARSRIQSSATLIEQVCVQIDQQQNTLNALKESNVESEADVDRTIDVTLAEIHRLTNQLNLKLAITDARGALGAITSVKEHLQDVALGLELNSDRKYSRNNYIQALENQKALVLNISSLEQQLLAATNRKKELEHFKQHNKVECPKCEHVWHQGYDERTYNVTLQAIAQFDQVIAAKKSELSVIEAYLEKAKAYLELYRVYASIERSWTVLVPLWDHVNNSGVIFDNPKQLLMIVDTFRQDLEYQIQIEDLKKRLDETYKLKELMKKNQQTSLANTQESVDKLNAELYRLQTENQQQNQRLARLNLYRNASVQISTLQSQIETTMGERDDKAQRLIELNKRDAINQAIEAVRIELNQREQMISRIDIQKALVDNIQQQIDELTEKAEILKLAVTELSPSQGLIAKGLTGFINHFVGQMNAFIKKIWLYPLEIVPIVPDEEDGVDLDYKFEFKVNDDMPIPDISKGSTGMKEVIDLAFKFVSMPYLGLSEFPVYLDELAASFDKSHREAAYRMVHDLMVNSNYSQIFIISHFADSYGSFNHSDIITLCDANIARARDSAFNRTVTIR